jgi:hypothetical protein
MTQHEPLTKKRKHPTPTSKFSVFYSEDVLSALQGLKEELCTVEEDTPTGKRTCGEDNWFCNSCYWVNKWFPFALTEDISNGKGSQSKRAESVVDSNVAESTSSSDLKDMRVGCSEQTNPRKRFTLRQCVDCKTMKNMTGNKIICLRCESKKGVLKKQ